MKQHDIDLDLSRPQVMAILNVTPDSFFAGSRMPDATHVERRVKEAAAEGASIIDVGGYSSRPGADEVPADPRTMQTLTDYKRDITAEVTAYFETKTADLLAAGIKRENIILDPGFGFAKTTEQNYELLAGLHRLCALGYPVLAGLSRKSMIYRVLDATPAESLAGTVALGWECLRQGASILRVHDVQEAVDTVRLFGAYERNCK